MKNRGLKDGGFNFGKALGLKQKKKDLVGIISKMCRDSFAKRPGLTGIDLALIDSGSLDLDPTAQGARDGSVRFGRATGSAPTRLGRWLGSRRQCGLGRRGSAAERLGGSGTPVNCGARWRVNRTSLEWRSRARFQLQFGRGWSTRGGELGGGVGAAKEINGDSIELGNGGGAARARESGASSGEGEKERGGLWEPYIG